MAKKKNSTTEENKGTREGKKGEQVHATIPKEQYDAIKKLEGSMGVDGNGVVANIITMWLYSQDWFMEIIKKQVTNNKK